MFLNSVILILQETLEAALLISVLLAFIHRLKSNAIWLTSGLAIGFLGAVTYGKNIGDISELFNYAGQEVFNASMQAAIVILMLLAIVLYARFIRTRKPLHASKFSVFAAAIVALAVTREGSEIYIYLAGAFSYTEFVLPTLTGSAIGIGIGMSMGVLFYYTINAFSVRRAYFIGLIVLSFIAGNMASQAILLLTQADWLPTTAVLWDTSGLLSERSLIGRLLYGLIGYEATPSILQFSGYLGAASTMLFLGIRTTLRSHVSHEIIHT